MLLQPMVENAVKHGIEPRLNGGTVEVEVRQEDGSLIFIVTDDGVGFVPSKKENVGLGAVRERLAVQFGAAAELQIERTAEQLTRVTIRIPIAKMKATAVIAEDEAALARDLAARLTAAWAGTVDCRHCNERTRSVGTRGRV